MFLLSIIPIYTYYEINGITRYSMIWVDRQ